MRHVRGQAAQVTCTSTVSGWALPGSVPQGVTGEGGPEGGMGLCEPA